MIPAPSFFDVDLQQLLFDSEFFGSCPVAWNDSQSTGGLLSFRRTAQIFQQCDGVFRSQNVHSQRQHAAQPYGVVDVIGVGVAGAGVEQDPRTVHD
jgi:hypothetical protein